MGGNNLNLIGKKVRFLPAVTLMKKNKAHLEARHLKQHRRDGPGVEKAGERGFDVNPVMAVSKPLISFS